MVATIFWCSEASAGSITIEIRHLWKNEPLTIPSKGFTTTAGETISVTRLSYLLSNPVLTRTETKKRLARSDWFAFVDAEAGNASIILRNLPDARISNLAFEIGLDEKADKSEISQYPANHPLNPLVNGLHWSPQGGYIFLALEGHTSEGGAFSYHLGNPLNRIPISLPVELDLNRDSTIHLDFHLDRIFDSDPPFATQSQTSTHSRKGDPVVEILKTRIAEAFTVKQVTDVEIIALENVITGEKTGSPLIGTPYRFKLRKGFPIPNLPTDYPLTDERIKLGEALFHDARLSRTNKISCASCHEKKLAFTDGAQNSVGVESRKGIRNSMPLLNLAWKNSFFWDGRTPSLREQALAPIEDHLEMDESLANVVSKIADYEPLFEKAFGSPEINAGRIGIAIEQFVITLTSFDSRFDQAAAGKIELTASEKRGLELFMTEFDPRRNLRGADCFHCHGGAFFTDHRFRNNGLASTGDDRGVENVTGKKSDRNKFSTPSLRNIALTAPYMHDGRFDSLEEVVAHYVSGIHRSETLDPNLGKHGGNGIPLSEDDQKALIAFLRSLTYEKLTTPEKRNNRVGSSNQ